MTSSIKASKKPTKFTKNPGSLNILCLLSPGKQSPAIRSQIVEIDLSPHKVWIFRDLIFIIYYQKLTVPEYEKSDSGRHGVGT